MRMLAEGIRERAGNISKKYHVREFEFYFERERAVEAFCSWKLLTCSYLASRRKIWC